MNRDRTSGTPRVASGPAERRPCRARRGARARAVGVALAFALACGSGAGDVGAQTRDLPEGLRTIAAVRFEGRRHLSMRELRAANLKTRRPSRFPWREKPALRADYLATDTTAIVALYRHYGYLDAHAGVRIESTRDPGAARVVFVIVEGPRTDVATVEFTGNASYASRELGRALYTKPHRPFDPAVLHLDTLKISQLYQERGFLPHTVASASRRPDAPVQADVRFDLTEGLPYRIGEIYDVRPPEARYASRLARRELLLKPGEIYRLTRVQRSIERLYQTGLWSQVSVTPLPDSSAKQMNFEMRLRERRPRWTDIGVGSGTTERFRTTAEWGHRDLFGRALQAAASGRLAFQAAGGKPHFQVLSGEASLLEPWLFGVRLSSRGRAFVHREDFRSDQRFVLRQSTRGFGVDLFRELGRISRLTIQQESNEVHQSYGPPDVGGIPDSTLDSLSRDVVLRYRTNVVRAVLERDLRDNRIAPTRGSYQTYSAALSGGALKGATSFYKHVLQSTWYTPLPNGWNFAARAGGGVIRPFGRVRQFTPGTDTTDAEVARVPFADRFRLGGENSLRAYRLNELLGEGGLAYVQGNLELRIPLVGPLGMEVYLDAGNVWDRAEYVRTRDFVAPWARGRARATDIRYAYGAGARLNLPFGPLRLDFSRKSRADEGDETHGFVPQFAIASSF